MNVGDLKKILKDLPDDMLIGGVGHYGNLLDCYDIYLSRVSKGYMSGKKIDILCIDIEDAGEEPD